MTSERPPRGSLDSISEEPATPGAILARAARRLTAATDVPEIRRVFGEAVSRLLGPCEWELHAQKPSESGEMVAVDPQATALSGMGVGLIGSPEASLDGASSVVVSPIGELGRRQALVVPLGRAGRLGTIQVKSSGDYEFTPDDVELLASLAAQVTLSLDRMRAVALRGSTKRMKTDLKAAREVQKALLPPDPPASSGFLVRTAYEPCFEVGGDCYDFVVPGPGELVVLIGDAAGKGVAAALLMTRLSGEFRGLAGASYSPGRVLRELNASLARRPHGEGFVTALCLRFSRSAGSVTVANAGHVLPILRRASGETMAFAPPSGAPLGLLDEEAYEEESTSLSKGDTVVLMTDGLLDALGAAVDDLGMDAAVALVRESGGDVDAVRSFVLGTVRAKSVPVDRPHRDDLALVVVQVA